MIKENKNRERKPIIIPEKRDFKGVWIPRKLYISRELSLSEKFVLLEIYSLSNSKDKKCYASNEHFANFVGLSTSSIQKMLSNFETKKYIKREYEYKKNSKEIARRWIVLQKKFLDDFINEDVSQEETAIDEVQSLQCGGNNSTDIIEKNTQCGGNNSTEVVEKSGYRSNTVFSSNTFNNNQYVKNSSEYASSLKDGGKNIYAFSEEKGQKKTDEDDEEEYKTIKEKLRYEVFPRIDDYIEDNYEYEYENGMNLVLEDIITEFYDQYFMKHAKEHRIMRPETYEKIVDRYFMPHEDMEDVYDFESYKSMIEYYFKTNYNKRGNYDGKIKLSIAHFFSENILRNLYHKIQC